MTADVKLAGVQISSDPRVPLEVWDAPLLNPWRERARGRRVLSVPVVLNCDDTSGNESKKYNEHNSVLFTLAGLPRDQVHLPFNVHFVSTSNIATPLEMMEAVKDRIM